MNGLLLRPAMLPRSRPCEDDYLRIDIAFSAVLGGEPVKINSLRVARILRPLRRPDFHVVRAGVVNDVVDERRYLLSGGVENRQCYQGFVRQIKIDPGRTERIRIG